MRKKPLSINIIALGYLLAPVVNIFLIKWMNDWPLTGPRGVFQHFSSYEWFVLGCFPVIAFGIYRVSRLGNIIFLGFSTLLIVHNCYSYLKNPVYSLYVVLLFNLATLGMVGFFLQKHIWAAYYNPNLRWWEHPYRYKTFLRAVIRVRQILVDGKLLDVSTGGCFIETRSTFKLGEILELSISLDDVHTTVRAKVAWLQRDEPRGYGLMFINLSKAQGKDIKKILHLLKARGPAAFESDDKGMKTA